MLGPDRSGLDRRLSTRQVLIQTIAALLGQNTMNKQAKRPIGRSCWRSNIEDQRIPLPLATASLTQPQGRAVQVIPIFGGLHHQYRLAA
jgi:hypothetical protein